MDLQVYGALKPYVDTALANMPTYLQEAKKIQSDISVKTENVSKLATDAQSSAETAQSAADSVSSSVAQIEQNKADIALKLDKPATDGTAGQVLQLDENNNTVWVENKAGLTEIPDDYITPKKTTFFVQSDIEYEIIEGRNVTFNGKSYIDGDDSCFTVYVKIPDKPFGCIYCTGRNATVVFQYNGKTYDTPTLICDKDKNILGEAGYTDVLTVFGSNILSNFEAPEYFAVTYLNGTEVKINLHSADAINKPFIPVAETELGEDFLIKGKNLISSFVNVQYDYNNGYWKYSEKTFSNLFEVQNGKTYYHNSSYIYLLCFDENYDYVSKIDNFLNGTTLEIAENVKYAVAYKMGESLPEDFWFSETDLSRKMSTPTKVVNPKYFEIEIDRKHMNNWYNGKRASFMGDSLSANGTGGFYITDLNDYFGFSNWTKTAIGGTYVSGAESVYGAAFWQDDRVNAVDIDSDVIFIMGGTNDANNNVSLGDNDISNCDTNTFYGAYNVLISKLIYKFYKLEAGYYSDIDYSGVTQVETAKPVKIFLITPPYMLNGGINYKKIHTFADAVVNIGKLLGCPVCDIRADSDVNLFLADYYAGYRNNNPEPDYVHLSSEAHHHWASVIIGKMLEVEPIW